MSPPFNRDRVWPNIRRTARAVVLGQSSLTIDLPEVREHGYFYGWQVLILETLVGRLENHEEHEVRAIYANWSDEEAPMTPFAVLRAVYWSRELQSVASSNLRQAEELHPISIPGRFVRLPLAQLQAWVRGFEHLLVPVGDPDGDKGELPIRRLRFDLGWIDQMTEKRWRSQDDAHAPLNEYWEQVWTEMTTVLDATPDIVIPSASTIQEHWSEEKILHPFLYSADDYDPRRITIDSVA